MDSKRTSTRTSGKKYCRIKVKRTIVATAPVAFKPFQGWRYLESERAPPDLSRGDTRDMPAEMAAELKRLGLLKRLPLHYDCHSPEPAPSEAKSSLRSG